MCWCHNGIYIHPVTAIFGLLSHVSTKFYHEEAKVEIGRLHDTIKKLQYEVDDQNLTFRDDIRVLRGRIVEQNIKFRLERQKTTDSEFEIGNLRMQLEHVGDDHKDLHKVCDQKQNKIYELREKLKQASDKTIELGYENGNLRKQLELSHKERNSLFDQKLKKVSEIGRLMKEKEEEKERDLEKLGLVLKCYKDCLDEKDNLQRLLEEKGAGDTTTTAAAAAATTATTTAAIPNGATTEDVTAKTSERASE